VKRDTGSKIVTNLEDEIDHLHIYRPKEWHGLFPGLGIRRQQTRSLAGYDRGFIIDVCHGCMFSENRPANELDDTGINHIYMAGAIYHYHNAYIATLALKTFPRVNFLQLEHVDLAGRCCSVGAAAWMGLFKGYMVACMYRHPPL
jgi:hypothetical protein